MPSLPQTRRNPNYSLGRYVEVGVEDEYICRDFRKLKGATKTIAILPILLSILPSDNSKSKMADLHELAYKEAYNARQTLYSFMIVEKIKKKSRINLQNIVVTDSILLQKNITSLTIGQYTPKELALLLGVETVILTTINHKEKITQPNLILDNIITATLAIFRSGVVNISAYDGRQDKMLTWYYQRDMTEGLGSETNEMFLVIMQRAAMFFPYFKG